jgi:hypothetical protein
LKELHIGTSIGFYPKEVTCVAFQTKTADLLVDYQELSTVLRLDASFTLPDLAELEHYENLKDAHLRLINDPLKDVLLMLKRCTNFRRLTLETRTNLCYRPVFATLEELCDFIMELKDLTFLHIIWRDSPYCYHFESEVDGVKEFV